MFIKIEKYNKHLNMSGFYLPSREALAFWRDFYRENRERDVKETIRCLVISCVIFFSSRFETRFDRTEANY